MESQWKANLIKALLAVQAIREKVGWRAYPARLASVQNPEFPCINFEIEGGSFPYRGAPFSIFSLRFWFYTEDSMNAAHELYLLADGVLKNSVIAGATVSIVLDPASTPIEIPEENLFCETVSYLGRTIHG